MSSQRTRRSLVAGTITASLFGITALCASVADATPVPSPIPSYPANNGAWYTNNSTVSQVAATVVVPNVSCFGNAVGETAGQFAGVQLYQTVGSNYGRESAVVNAYCVGHAPVYNTVFEVNDVTGMAAEFSPAGVRVNPGDVVQLNATATPSAASLSITNLSTSQRASVTGEGFTADAGLLVGVGLPAANASGGVLMSGSVPDSTASVPAINGPVPSLPFAFLNVTADGGPLTQVSGLYSNYWTTTGTSSGQTIARVTPVGFNAFGVVFTL